MYFQVCIQKHAYVVQFFLLYLQDLYPQPDAGGVPLWYPTNFSIVVVSQIVNELGKNLHIILIW